MKSIPNLTQESLSDLYKKGLSMRQMAYQLNCSEHKIKYWMSKFNIARRTRSDANYIYYNPNGDPFSIKHNLTSDEKMLFGLGVGIYWGEGDKKSHHQLRVTNTDSGIIKQFIRFLIDVCQVKKEKISYSIVCFNDTKPDNAATYWAKELGISKEKFGKIVQIPPQGKGTYKRKSEFGVCSVIVSNTKLKAWILNELDNLRY